MLGITFTPTKVGVKVKKKDKLICSLKKQKECSISDASLRLRHLKKP